MLILLSPAKTLDFTPTERTLSTTKPQFSTAANKLAKVVRERSPSQLGKLMGISNALAKTTHGYFQDYKLKWDAIGSKPAVLALRGDVYLGLDADTLTTRQLQATQAHLRILSGLYGVLRPLDLIQPYRLEMGTSLKNEAGKDLYAFWGDRLTAAINRDAAKASGGKAGPTVINLASNEYFAAVSESQLEAELITPTFKDESNGKFKVLSFFAKRARGMFARHLLESGFDSAAITDFSSAGYRYCKKESKPGTPTFLRKRSDIPKAKN